MQHNDSLEAGIRKRSLPASVYVLTASVAVIGSNSLVLGPIAPLIALSLGSSVPNVMMAMAAFGLGAAASALFLSHYIDRLGPARVLRIAMGLLPLALLLSAAAPFVSVLVLAQLLAGVASGLALPAIYTSAAVIAPPGLESKTVGVVLAGWTLSMVAGVSVSAMVADLLDWRAVYGAVATLAAIAIVSLSRMKDLGVREKVAAPVPLSALKLAGIKPLLVSCGAFMAGFYGVYAFLGDYLRNGLGEPLSANGLLAMFYGVGFGGAVLFERLVSKAAARSALPVALALVALIYLLLAVGGSTLLSVLILMLLLGLANHYGVNLFIVRLTAIDPTKRGAIMGLYSAVTNLAVFAGTSSFGQIYSAGGFVTIAYTAMALSLLAALVCVFFDGLRSEIR
ncbi:MFS transporter [Burkholderia gladioli pv. alliicola]|uniref:MFS transporter n=1 Tax=Burkholderia gladioli TaxID=28095 RepID=UPI003D81845A